MNIIEFKNITKTYKTGKIGVAALQGVSLTVAGGEFIAIMGPSGSGKSTLLHLIGLLDRPDSGSYYLEGKDVTGLGDNKLAVIRNSLMGFIFQQFHLLSRVSALENAELPLIYAGKRHLKEVAAEKQKDAFMKWSTDVNKRAALVDYLALPAGQEAAPEDLEAPAAASKPATVPPTAVAASATASAEKK